MSMGKRLQIQAHSAEERAAVERIYAVLDNLSAHRHPFVWGQRRRHPLPWQRGPSEGGR